MNHVFSAAIGPLSGSFPELRRRQSSPGRWQRSAQQSEDGASGPDDHVIGPARGKEATQHPGRHPVSGANARSCGVQVAFPPAGRIETASLFRLTGPVALLSTPTPRRPGSVRA